MEPTIIIDPRLAPEMQTVASVSPKADAKDNPTVTSGIETTSEPKTELIHRHWILRVLAGIGEVAAMALGFGVILLFVLVWATHWGWIRVEIPPTPVKIKWGHTVPYYTTRMALPHTSLLGFVSTNHTQVEQGIPLDVIAVVTNVF